MARDALNYAQSTALFLEQAGALPALPHWAAVRNCRMMHSRFCSAPSKLGWVRFLPQQTPGP